MEIIRGKVAKAQKCVVYGPEGIGKSTFAAQFPDPLFIDTEGSTNNMDVARLPKPSSMQMLVEQINFVKINRPCKTLVIDTVDWAERLIVEQICSQHGKTGIEDFGYGNGYTFTAEAFGKFLNLLSDVIEVGINVVLTAHAQIRKFEQPDEMGAYDRYELKLGKKTSSQTAPLAKEWADMVLFCNYKTLSVATDDKGKKYKAQGGTRVIYTEHHPAWDAKNRHGLSAQLKMDYAEIAHIFLVEPTSTGTMERVLNPTAVQIPPKPTEQSVPTLEETIEEVAKEFEPLPSILPQDLKDLMQLRGFTFKDLQEYAFRKEHMPKDTPAEGMVATDNYVEMLVANWDAVEKDIEVNKVIPF